MGDDAAGPWVVEHLRAEYEIGPGASLTDVGTPGRPRSLHRGARVVILVDTVKSKGRRESSVSTGGTSTEIPAGAEDEPSRPWREGDPPLPRDGGERAGGGAARGDRPGPRGEGALPDAGRTVALAIPEAAEAVAVELRRLGNPGPAAASAPARPWWAGEEGTAP